MVVIPARMHSTRLPQKMLLGETGKPLIQHTYESAARARLPERTVVATDHPKIFEAVKGFGGTAMMTDPQAQSGTDRVAEVASKFPEYELFVNVQGDEPEISGDAIDLAIQSLVDDDEAVMSTLVTPIRDEKNLMDPACVKVVFDDQQNAMYFSRSPIPFARDGWEGLLDRDPPIFHLHVGLYCYRRSFLMEIKEIPVSSLERTECLEQLRVLQRGFRIKTAVIPQSHAGIDTREDYQAFVKRQMN